MTEKTNENADTFIVADAFCGAGGLSKGLKDAGFTLGVAFDIDADAIATYRRNLGEHAFVASVTEVTPDRLKAVAGAERFTLVAGGPPCQGFSVQRRGGEEDPRNSLPLAFFSLINALDPPFFLFENVRGIRRRHGEAILAAFLEEAYKAGYVCHAEVLDAVHYGVPQVRKRLFVVGEKSPTGDVWFEFPARTTDERSEETRVGYAFRGLPEPPPDYSDHPTVPNHRRTRLSDQNLERIRHVPQGGGMKDLPERLRVKAHQAGPEKIGHRYVYGRLHLDEPAATITARFDSFTRGKFGHPTQDRNITLREGARLQTFPDDFVFLGGQEEIAAQIGNAVPPVLGRALGAAILDAIARRSRGDSPLRTGTPRQLSLF